MSKDSADGQVLFYTHTLVEIPFPGDRVCCRFCPLLETYARHQCRRTGEYILDIDLTGGRCPLVEMEENDGNPTASSE